MKRVFLFICLSTAILISLAFAACDSGGGQGCGGETGEPYEPPVPSDTVNPGASPLVAEGHYFRDARGGLVFLRGVNVAGNAKVPPFRAITSREELAVLPGLGVNALRLLFIWEAYEPVEGDYSEAYMAYYRQVVTWAGELGLYVIVDFHQDAYSRYLLAGCGEGFPRWAVSPEVAQSAPDNGGACTSWGVRMLNDDGLATAWRHFHDDTYGAKSAYLDMVARVTGELAPHGNIIGYDLINEPWGTDDQLHTLFEQVGARIRAEDPQAILFVPTHALVTGGTRNDTTPMPAFANAVYAPHYYNGAVLLLKNWGGADPAIQLDKLRNKAETGDVPMLLGEFGAPAGTGNGLGYIAAQLDWLDRYWISATQWNYTPGWREDVKDGWNMEDLSIVDGRGNLRDNFVVRPYPQRVGGAPERFDRDDAGFTLTWDNRVGYGETVVYLPDGFATGKTLRLLLPDGAGGNCEILAHSMVCRITGAGTTVVSVTR